jgi:hypothetical protein
VTKCYCEKNFPLKSPQRVAQQISRRILSHKKLPKNICYFAIFKSNTQG